MAKDSPQPVRRCTVLGKYCTYLLCTRCSLDRLRAVSRHAPILPSHTSHSHTPTLPHSHTPLLPYGVLSSRISHVHARPTEGAYLTREGQVGLSCPGNLRKGGWCCAGLLQRYGLYRCRCVHVFRTCIVRTGKHWYVHYTVCIRLEYLWFCFIQSQAMYSIRAAKVLRIPLSERASPLQGRRDWPKLFIPKEQSPRGQVRIGGMDDGSFHPLAKSR